MLGELTDQTREVQPWALYLVQERDGAVLALGPGYQGCPPFWHVGSGSWLGGRREYLAMGEPNPAWRVTVRRLTPEELETRVVRLRFDEVFQEDPR